METANAVVTSTKQFVWNGVLRCEERDSLGAQTKVFLGNGVLIGSTKYFYAVDHLGSLRTLTDNSGNIQAELNFDSYGNTVPIVLSLTPDLTYAHYYFHSRSGLDLSLGREYQPKTGTWLRRDPTSAERNDYAYVANSPTNRLDPTGNDFIQWEITPLAITDPFPFQPGPWAHVGLYVNQGSSYYHINGAPSNGAWSGGYLIVKEDPGSGPLPALNAGPIISRSKADVCSILKQFPILRDKLDKAKIPYSAWPPYTGPGGTSNQIPMTLLDMADVNFNPQQLAPILAPAAFRPLF